MAFAIGSWPGCDIYNPSLLTAADAAPEAAPLHLATIPSIPADDDDSGLQKQNFVLAMQSIDVAVGLDGGPLPTGPLPPIGWDLDKVDTCPGAPSCVQPAGTIENCDDDAGRDHTGLKLFRELGPSAQMGVAAVNQSMTAGEYGLLVQVTGYNGTLNDRQVSVALYFSSGVIGTDGGALALNHDGYDAWSVDPRSIAGYMGGTSINGMDCGHGSGLCPPQYATDAAYVSGGILVANLGVVPITFGGRANIGGAVMELNGTFLTGTLEPVSLFNNNTWRIKGGSISGRWQSQKLLSNLATIPDPTTDAGLYLCGDADVPYQLLKKYICTLQDISAIGMDNVGAPCDAISMAFGFTAEPAQLGVVAPLPSTPQGCTNGGLPFHDTCPQ
ncbi:MAG: hypothetical protein ACRENE_00605 [Polyangiaceae bacterium]